MVNGDVDPRELAVRAADPMQIDTTTSEFRAVRDWVMELEPHQAAWLEHAVRSGRVYAEWLTERQ